MDEIDGEIPEHEALAILAKGFLECESHPACIVFQLSEQRILTYWRHSHEFGDCWTFIDTDGIV